MSDAEKNQHDDDDIIENQKDLSGDAKKSQAGSNNKRNDLDGSLTPAHEILSDEEKRALMDFDTGENNKTNKGEKTTGKRSKADTDAAQANGEESTKENTSNNSSSDIPVFDPADNSIFQRRRIHSAGRKAPSNKAKDKAASHETEQKSKTKSDNDITTKAHGHLLKKPGINTRTKEVELEIKSGSSPKKFDSHAGQAGKKENLEKEQNKAKVLSSDRGDEIIAQIVSRDIEKLCGR